ncbi:error-prone DNA polymerase [Planctomicrobium sp. SH527]|uniref:error-prone DNA polymerase n=1 Tax=Planctomicrobium sp. SH527 TaxID=3448123 RepID=UPI003F5C74BE
MPEHPNPKLPRPVPHVPPVRFNSGTNYVELHCKTNYSFLTGAAHPDELVQRAADLGHRALAITDLNSVAGVVRAYAAAKVINFKLLIGAEITPVDAPPVILYCQNREGYANLCRLLTLGRRRSEKGNCTLHFSDIADHSRHLLAGVLLNQTISRDEGLQHAQRYRELFEDRAYGLASLHMGPDDVGWLNRLKRFSQQTGLPLAASNDVHYHIPQRRLLQDVLTAIRHGCPVAELGRRRFSNGERYLKSPEQMADLFAAAPEAVQRTTELADRCTFSLEELKYEYPRELCPPGKTLTAYLRELTEEGVRKRYPHGVPVKIRNTVEQELALIAKLQYESYFLTVWDLVRFARSQGILCQGRGSAANSAVCYCLGVTSVDPNHFDLLFERFISVERGEAPDIDIDFEHERREEVLQYIYGKYGRERAGMTATVITYRPRSAIRDVGKALGLSLDGIDRLAKGVDHYADSEQFASRFQEQGLNLHSHTGEQLLSLSREILGFPRHLSQHVGGMIITQRPLCEMVPIENASMPGRTVIQWDKDDLDTIGILKVDCLSLGMLTAIQKSFRLLEEHHQRSLTLATIPQEDQAVYQMITKADTIGVFQVESRAQMAMHPRLQPKTFYDLVVAVAIVRPGPIQGNMVNPYLRRRAGEEKPDYPDERLKDVLWRTLGVPLFQEQVMKLAMVAAGFSAGEADRLRRAMAAWRRNGSLDQFEPKLIAGMKQNGYGEDLAKQLFKMMRGFGEYGFPESHAASFALLAYASAWLKCYYPDVFCCALLNSQPMGFYAPAQLVRDAREHEIEVRPVDVNFSHWDCTLEEAEAGVWKPIRLGMRIVRGFRQSDAERIVQARSAGAFQNFAEFASRTRLQQAALSCLSRADAFESFQLSRRDSTWQALMPTEISPLFENEESEDSNQELPALAPQEEVTSDYQSLGLSLRSHPLSFLRAELNEVGITSAVELLQGDSERPVKVAGLVLLRQRPSTAKGITFVTLEDETGHVNLIVYQNIWDQYRQAAVSASLMIVSGQLQRHHGVIHVVVNRIQDGSQLLQGVQVKSRDFH